MRTLRLLFPFLLSSALAIAADGTSDQGFSTLPTSAQVNISAALGQDETKYHVRPVTAGFEASGPGFASHFTSVGIEVTGGSAHWRMAFRGYGYGGTLTRSDAVAPHAMKNRVEYRRGAVTEWYVNGPAGLEQGFTINARPKNANGLLTIALETSGNLKATADNGRTSLKLLKPDGEELMRYAGLTAYDAGGQELRASLEVHARELLLRVDDRGAEYPVVIDPVVQLAKLTLSDGGSQDAFGVSVSMSGNVIVAGSIVNAAYVFVKPPGGWQAMTQAAKLTPSDGVEGDFFGYSVAISGNVIVVGAPQATVNGNVFQGAAYVFVRPTGGWRDMTETAKLVASDGAAGDAFGQVAVSGRTAIVGAPLAAVEGAFNQGAAYVFEPPMGEWPSHNRIILTEAAKLTASDTLPDEPALFGSAVAIAGDTAAVGALLGNGGEGEAYVFVKPEAGWSNGTETATLKSSDVGGLLGASIAINGKTVAAGAPTHGTNGLQGAVYIFVEPNDGWSDMTEAAQLLAAKANGQFGWSFGTSVAIDSSGRVIATGAPQGNGHHFESGAVFVFVRPPAGWQTTVQANIKLIASDGQYGDVFGTSISLGGKALVLGASSTQNGPPPSQGAAYVFGAQ